MAAPIPSDDGWRRARATACCALASVLGACVSERPAREEPPAEPVVFESRTGVPLLMDLPLVGWMFQRRVTVR